MKTLVSISLVSLFCFSFVATPHRDSTTESKIMKGFSVKADTIDKKLDDIVNREVNTLNCLNQEYKQQLCQKKSAKRTKPHIGCCFKQKTDSNMSIGICSHLWAN